MNTINDVSIRQQQVSAVGEDTSTLEITERSKKALEYGFPGNDKLTALINKSDPRALPSTEGEMSVASAQAGASVFSQSAGIDFGRIAEIILKLDFESEKASKDMVISDILDVATSMNESADKIMASAGLSLAAGVISGVASIAAGGISIAGGAKTMSIVNEAQSGSSSSAVSEDVNSTVQEATSGTVTTPSGIGKSGAASSTSEVSLGEMNTAENIQELTQQATQQTNATPQADANLQNMQSQTQAFVLSQRANSISLTTQGLSQVVSGTGQIASSGLKFGSDQQQAASKRTDAMTERRRASLERERQYADTIDKSANSLKQMLLDVEQGRYQTSAQTMRV
ncbi:MAG: hypothetical protein ACNYNY_05700 [Candidatus Oxydemutatoraceae bacterium WSBS_2016_MAG_OTU14]